MNEQMLNEEYKETAKIAAILLASGFNLDRPDVKLFGDIPPLPKVEIGSSIAANILLGKIPNYGVKLIPPDWLIYLIEVCADGRPGFIQLIYKELLEDINNTKYDGMGIPENYAITATDFVHCYRIKYPIILNPEIDEKYSKMWDAQKRETRSSFESDNLCDTKEYWLEVMA